MVAGKTAGLVSKFRARANFLNCFLLNCWATIFAWISVISSGMNMELMEGNGVPGGSRFMEGASLWSSVARWKDALAPCVQ